MVHFNEDDFGAYKGEAVKRFTWSTTSGLSVSVISYGAIIQSVKYQDKHGEVRDVALGFDDLEGYVKKNTPYFGATIGRCANRIGRATFEIDGVVYHLAKNVGRNHLHGGLVGFDKVVWKPTVAGNKVTLSYHSSDGEEGYPGDLVVNATFEVKDDDALYVDFKATTTKKTVVNLTNHSYFNLAGHDTGAEELYNHVISINADRITETDDESIPTGGFIKVGGTPYDLRVARRIGDVITQDNSLYDNNFCVSDCVSKDQYFMARVTHPKSGRTLEIYSNQPGVQFYTSNGLPSPSEPALEGKGGVGYRRHGALALETQDYPDAVNHSNFPSAVLCPGDLYLHTVVYRFGVEKVGSPSVILKE